MELSDVVKRLRHNANDIRGGEEKLAEMKPELENVKKQVEDGYVRQGELRINLLGSKLFCYLASYLAYVCLSLQLVSVGRNVFKTTSTSSKLKGRSES